MRVNLLRRAGYAAFLAAIALISCSGGGTTRRFQPTPAPSGGPTVPTPTPTPLGPSPTPTPTPTGIPTPTRTGIRCNGDDRFQRLVTRPVRSRSTSSRTALRSLRNRRGRAANTSSRTPSSRTSSTSLALNLPVNDIRIGTCPKPTAPPTDITTITYQNETSGDVSCPGNNAKTKAVYESVLAVENALDLRSMLRRRRF